LAALKLGIDRVGARLDASETLIGSIDTRVNDSQARLFVIGDGLRENKVRLDAALETMLQLQNAAGTAVTAATTEKIESIMKSYGLKKPEG
jgi:hypothetical protein